MNLEKYFNEILLYSSEDTYIHLRVVTYIYDARNTMIQVMNNVYCLQNDHPAQCGALGVLADISRDSSKLHTLWLGHLHHCEPQLPFV